MESLSSNKCMTRRLIVALFYCALSMARSQASAMGLLEAYNDALANDPLYRSQIHEHDAGVENKILGRSNLLPVVAINYSGSKNWAETTQPDPTTASGYSTTRPIYISSTGGLSIRQPLYSPDGVAKYREGNAQAEYSDVQFSGRQQELLTRMFSAYVEVLFSNDALKLATAQRNTFLEQKVGNEHMFKVGEGTKTDVLETQAKLDLSEAQLIEAQDTRSVDLQALASIVGKDVFQLDGLVDTFQAQPLQPNAFEEWKTLALQHNPELLAQHLNVEIANQEVKRNRAGHLPHVDLIASATKDKADTIDTYTTDSTVRSVGVQVTIPIYSGGSVSAMTRQAVANYEKAKSDMEDKTNQILLDMHKQHYTVLSSLAKINALVKSVDSAKLLVVATQQSIKGGTRVNLDLLNAEQQLYTAQRDLAQTRYAYLVADFKLRADAGVLGIDDLRNIAGYFVATQ